MKKIILSIAVLSSILSAELFDKGKTAFGVVAGAGSSNGDSYFVAGVNADYFVMNGLSVGAGYRGWFGDDPTQHQITLSTNYYLSLNNQYHPYVGVFGRETFRDDFDYTSYGGRVGIAMRMSPTSYVSAGYAFEESSDCPFRFDDCSNSYPEFVFSLAF